MRVYGSRAYAAQLKGRVALKDLDWISWAAPNEQLRINQKLDTMIPGFKAAFTSDDFNVQLAACKAGVDAMLLPQMLHLFRIA